MSKRPTTKVLALAFLHLIGMVLVADGFGFHVPKGYICSASAFAVPVEAANVFARRKSLKSRHTASGNAAMPVADRAALR